MEDLRKANLPTISTAVFARSNGADDASGLTSVLTTLSRSSPDDCVSKSFSQTIVFPPADPGAALALPVAEAASGNDVTVRSPSQTYTFTSWKTEKDTFVGVASNDGSFVSTNCKDIHGKVYARNSTFGSICFIGADEGTLLYIAEEKPPKETEWGVGVAEDPAVMTTKYAYRDHWGEQHTDISSTAIFVWKWATPGEKPEKVEVSGLDNVTLGSVSEWNSHLVFTAFENTTSFRLGAQYCINRLSGIYTCPLAGGAARKLSTSSAHCRAPIITPDGAFVLWLETPAPGPHSHASTIMKVDFQKAIAAGDEDSGAAPEKATPNPYYTSGFAQNRFVDADTVIFTRIERSTTVLSVLNISTGAVTDISSTLSSGTWNVFDVFGDKVLAGHATLTHPLVLKVGTFAKESPESVAWTQITAAHDLGLRMSYYEGANNTDVCVLLPPENAPYPSLPKKEKKEEAEEGAKDAEVGEGDDASQAKEQRKTPAIVVPHGGPHSVFIQTYYSMYAAFALGGYAIIFPNYRGSTGWDDETLKTLLGKVGTQDVEDVVALVDVVLAQEPSIDAGKLIVSGGSHGGFLTAHLTAQYPDKFIAAALRNPVIDISSMVMVTDIPDWCFTEAGIPVKKRSEVTPEELAKMKAASPFPLAKHVKTPSMIMLGLKDLRVPPFQGKLWFEALRENGVEVEMFYYPEDCHPLTTPKCSVDVHMNLFLWFTKHL